MNLNITKESYAFTTEYVGQKEVAGPQDNPLIVCAHKLTGHAPQKSIGKSVDEIPWCASWVNLAIICANIRRNPQRTIEMLLSKGIIEQTIIELFKYAKVNYLLMKDIDTLQPIAPPTWSAAASSFREWGQTVPFDKAQRGDIICLTRKGGNHVAFLDEDSLGKVFLKLLGGNQSNKVCSSETYLRARLVSVRRGF